MSYGKDFNNGRNIGNFNKRSMSTFHLSAKKKSKPIYEPPHLRSIPLLGTSPKQPKPHYLKLIYGL